MKAFFRNPEGLLASGLAAGFGLILFLAPLLSRANDIQPGNVDQGKAVFEKRCTGCHSLDDNKEGPHLRGVFGRKAGKLAGFDFSDAMKNAQFTWDAAALDKWLTDTESVVPNNDMSFHVPNPQERADVIRFLESLSEK